jgi:hypothetical protein
MWCCKGVSINGRGSNLAWRRFFFTDFIATIIFFLTSDYDHARVKKICILCSANLSDSQL